MQTVVEILRHSETWLKTRGFDSPRLEAEMLLGHALGMTRVQVYLQFDRPMESAELDQIRELLRRRGEHEPIAWIIGERGFYEHDFIVRPGVLVPRPDTEALVEAALAFLPEDEERFVADIGCGSGALGLSIAAARPLVKLYAVDLSDAALDCTRENVAALDLKSRVAVLRGDLLAPIPPSRPIDVIVSNPPYIATAVLETLQPEVRDIEPRLALDGGADGLDIYRRLIPAAAARARQAVLMEVGFDQGPDVAALFKDAGLIDVIIKPDLGGRDRVVQGRVPAA